MTNPLAATAARTIITHTTACATSPGPCSCNYDARLRAMEAILDGFAGEVVKGRGQPVADLAAARAALANSDRIHARERDEGDPFCLACGTTLSLRDECEWPTDGPLCDGCADDERVVFRDGLRAALTHADQLAVRVAELEEQAAARERAFVQATEFQYKKSDEREAALKAVNEALLRLVKEADRLACAESCSGWWFDQMRQQFWRWRQDARGYLGDQEEP